MRIEIRFKTEWEREQELDQYWQERQNRAWKWKRWFAWYPIINDQKELVWLETVWRRWAYDLQHRVVNLTYTDNPEDYH